MSSGSGVPLDIRIHASAIAALASYRRISVPTVLPSSSYMASGCSLRNRWSFTRAMSSREYPRDPSGRTVSARLSTMPSTSLSVARNCSYAASAQASCAALS